MKRLVCPALKVVAVAVLVLAVVAGAGWTYVMAAYPRLAPPRALKVAGTPEQVARGAYLSHHVVGCTDCHGERDWTRYSAPQMPSREGHGGMTFRLPRRDLARAQHHAGRDRHVDRRRTAARDDRRRVARRPAAVPDDAVRELPRARARRCRSADCLRAHAGAGGHEHSRRRRSRSR